jgi:hypothetical protein
MLPEDAFSARWTRKVDLDRGTYRFHVLADDGIRLWVDDRTLIDEWRDHDTYQAVTEYALVKGTHTIRVEYYERIGKARVHVWWEKVDSPSYPDWKGRYWPNSSLSGNPVLVRNDVVLDFGWGAGAPAAGLPEDGFSVRWTRNAAFEAATYRFHALVDDGVRLWVDGRLLIDDWRTHSEREVVATYALVRGRHKVKVEYYEQSGDARIRVWWEKIASPSYPDWKARYWSNRNLKGEPVLVRNDQEIDFHWDKRAPAAGLPADGFSARWSRTQKFRAGVYRFYALADDGVRVYVDGKRVINEWHASSGEVYQVDLPLKGSHKIVVEYSEHTGNARVRVWWRRLGN